MTVISIVVAHIERGGGKSGHGMRCPYGISWKNY
jgi:hypothetical protein